MKTALEIDAPFFFLKQKYPFHSQEGKNQIKTLHTESLKAVQRLWGPFLSKGLFSL